VQISPQPQAEFVRPTDVVFIPQTNLLTNWSITTGVDVQLTNMHSTQVQALTSFAEQLAIGLAQTLNILKIYNEPAINQIMTVLEPYMEAIPEIDFHIPPKSSREVIIEVTREGRATPKIYFNETL
jgi:hypothetical protein